jgi:diaminohydroxyphosphoribosylaminopyrimidine deaminase/5-amino-6-(5-phosphoribosylamino)uracil reductase
MDLARVVFGGAGAWAQSPNPLVGAVVVDGDGVIVDRLPPARGEPHAEVLALEESGVRAQGATMYCTLEPCCHVGRTGPCAARIVEAGISRIVAAIEDPNPLVNGKGFEHLRAHGVEVEVGLGAPAALAPK